MICRFSMNVHALSVFTSSDCKFFTLKKAVFQEFAAKGSPKLRKIFDKYAMHKTTTGAINEFYMSSGQFVDALREEVMTNKELNPDDWKEKLRFIEDIAEACAQGELIPFPEFIKRVALMNKDFPEGQIAFRLFNDGTEGIVKRSFFREVLIDVLKPDTCPFDIFSAVSMSPFGRDKILHIDEFMKWFQKSGKLNWKTNDKILALREAIDETCEESYCRHRRIGVEEMLSEDGLTSVRAINSGYSPFPVTYLFAGGVAGIISRTLCFPLTRLKILMQADLIQSTKLAFGGSSPFFQQSFFQGNCSNLFRTVSHMGLQFYTYECLSQTQGKDNLGLPQRFLYGGIAGLTALSLTYPLDVVRTYMVVATPAQQLKNFSTLETFLNIIKQEGTRSLFKGYVPAAAHVFPFVATEFCTYEFAKSFFSLNPLFAGTIAGTAASAATFPLEVVRRRLQVQNFVKNQNNYSGLFNGLKTIFQQQGIAGLYQGFVPSLLRVAPAVGVSFFTYESSLPFFRDMFEDHRFERNYHYPEVVPH